MAAEVAAGSRIFISYRREDAIAHVNALFTPLRNRFGGERVFKDTDNIAPGQDFAKVIQSQLKTCSVLLAVIGKHWVTARKPKSDIRRIDDPHDYLRVEIVTALGNDAVLVIPILVGEATMPAPEDLPEDLVPLSRRNGFELRDSRWEADVNLLIRSIEKACGEPEAATLPPAPHVPEPLPPAADKPPAEERGGLDRFAARRNHQIAEHVRTARLALDALQYDEALEACDKALWLDPQDRDARDLQKRIQDALDEQKIQGWLGEARQLLSGEQVQDAQLTAASELIDEAIAVNPTHAAATDLRGEVIAFRRQRERGRDDARHVHAVLARAREHLELEEFDACIAACDDALTVASSSAEATELRQRAVAAREQRRRNRDVKRRAEKAVEADRTIAAAQPSTQVRRSSRFRLVAAAVVAPLVLGGVGAWGLYGRSGDTGEPSQIAVSLPQPSSQSAEASRNVVPIQSTDAASPPALDPKGPSPAGSISASSTPPTEPVDAAKVVPAADANRDGEGSPPVTRPRANVGEPASSRTTSRPRQADTANKDDRRRSAVKPVSAAEPTELAASPRDMPAAPAPAAKPPTEKQTDQAPVIKPPAPEITREGNVTRVVSQIETKEPTRLRGVSPVYPQAALDARAHGTVVLEAIVGEDGKVRNIKVVKSIPLLDQAAIDALKQWEYAPGTRNGVAVAVEITVSITFSM